MGLSRGNHFLAESLADNLVVVQQGVFVAEPECGQAGSVVKPEGVDAVMTDLMIGLAFVAMVLTPAIVASFHKKEESDDDE